MEKARELIRKREQALNGWGLLHLRMDISSPPIFDRRCESYRGAQTAFDAHKCDQHPLNRKTASEGRELKRPCRAGQNLRHIFVQKRQGSSTKSKGILCE